MGPTKKTIAALCTGLVLLGCGESGDDGSSSDANAAANNGATEPTTPPDTSKPYLDDETARHPFRDGKDYPGDRIELDRRIQAMVAEAYDGEPRKAFAIVAPHAGLKFSGAVAAGAYARVEVPDTVILLAPKHHSIGASPSLWKDGPFIVPGHALHPNLELVDSLAEKAGEEVEFDRDAFTDRNNHPTELQLPFISTLNPDAELVPVVFEDTSRQHFASFDLERIRAWGKALADLVREIEADGGDVLVVASNDLVHRTPLSNAEPQNEKFMQQVVDLDLEAMHEWVTTEEITICGEIIVAVTMAAAIELGYTDVELTGLATSYDRNGNAESVVGYGGAVIWPNEESN